LWPLRSHHPGDHGRSPRRRRYGLRRLSEISLNFCIFLKCFVVDAAPVVLAETIPGV
jgi:hypothetical protein